MRFNDERKMSVRRAVARYTADFAEMLLAARDRCAYGAAGDSEVILWAATDLLGLLGLSGAAIEEGLGAATAVMLSEMPPDQAEEILREAAELEAGENVE